MRDLHIRAAWDQEAGVWYVAESEVPGLSTEGRTVEELLDRIRDRVPDLIALNARHLPSDVGMLVSIQLSAERRDMIPI